VKEVGLVAGWVDPRHEMLSPVIALARELSDPIRLTALQVLAAEGPHTMSQLAQALGVSAPRLGNHLARLREQGLVTVEHTGRHAVYRVAAPGLGDVLAALSRYAHAGLDLRPDRPPPSPADLAHTCYDHAAGRLGIAVFGTLVARGALSPPDGRDDQLTLGPDPAALTELGLDIDALDTGRRKLATACLDKIYRLPHLGGALGKAVLDTFLARRLVVRQENTRTLTLTPKGRAALPVLLPDFSPDPR
jgi:DNA-binding transcriptional ArsR family regulator